MESARPEVRVVYVGQQRRGRDGGKKGGERKNEQGPAYRGKQKGASRHQRRVLGHAYNLMAEGKRSLSEGHVVKDEEEKGKIGKENRYKG